MKIVLDCPGCGKRYEVDRALAGKKSRCKDCGNTFRIPDAQSVPAASASTSVKAASALSAVVEVSGESGRQRPPSVLPEVVAVPTSPAIVPSGGARGTIVFNCPRCFKRYELDLGLAGKKSRCKDCKEVFTIPTPMVAAVAVPEAVEPPGKKSALGTRNFAVIPEEVVPKWVEDLDVEPVTAPRPAPPPPVEEELVPLLPRAAYPERPHRKSRRREEDTDAGVTVAGWYSALVVLAIIGLAIWHAALVPEFRRIVRVWEVLLGISFVIGVILSFWANIWLLVIAFRDKVEQGLLVLLVPLYALYYILSRWRETRGILALTAAPPFCVFLFLMLGGYSLGLKGPTMFVEALRDRVGSMASDLSDQPNQNKQEVAIAVYRDYALAMNRFGEEVTRLNAAGDLRMNPFERENAKRQILSVTAEVTVAEKRALALRLNPVDMIAVKKVIGAEVRAAMIALKYQLSLFVSRYNASGQLDPVIAALDRALLVWEDPNNSNTTGHVATLGTPPAQGPSGPDPGGMAPGRMAPGEMQPGFPPGGMPPGFPPGGTPMPMPRFETLEAHFDRMRKEYGDRAVMVVLVGLPTNSDPSIGVTKRDVEVAIDKRLKALAPESSQSRSMGSGGGRSICLVSVENVKRLAQSIDFGKATLNGSRIDVIVSRDYIASVPRQPGQPPLARRNPLVDEPKVPAGADVVTRSLIELKSADMHRIKEALSRLTLVRPNDRAKDVLADVLPLLEHPDEDLVKHAVRVVAVWQSPDALAKLIDLVHDPRVFLRHEVIKTLGRYDDAKAAEAIISRFKDDGFQAEDALKSMGAVAEPPLIELLRNPDADIRKKACEILKFVGGAATLKAMAKIPPDPDFFVRLAAKDAIGMIRLRVGNSPSDEPDEKKSKPPAPKRASKKS